ncbi:MAG: hypothetical protein WCI87_09025, partial [Euryarchaeota archaeon]
LLDRLFFPCRAAGSTSDCAYQKFTMKGQLFANGIGVGATTITFKRSTENATWNAITTILGYSSGGYTFIINETSTGTYYYRTTYAGDTTHLNATNNVVKVTVKKPTTLNATAPNTATVKQKFTIRGRLTASGITIPSTTIVLQRSTDSKTYTMLTTRRRRGRSSTLAVQD